jgi:hypothetical protein
MRETDALLILALSLAVFGLITLGERLKGKRRR